MHELRPTAARPRSSSIRSSDIQLLLWHVCVRWQKSFARAAVAAPWEGHGFDVVVYGRPEGMTIEHCVLSAAFDREPTTCRDLCVQKHPVVSLTDPAGYTFPVATDFACRNRLLHSR